MLITIHAGHNPDGKKGSGAVGIIKESTECRKIAKAVYKKLKKKYGAKHVNGITVNYGKNATDVLHRLVNKCNTRYAKQADKKQLNISIHMNCANKTAQGTEILYNPSKSKSPKVSGFVGYMERAGFKWRGVKECTNLYILNNFKGQTYLIETLFCDNKHDTNLYKQQFNKIVDAIVQFVADNYKKL